MHTAADLKYLTLRSFKKYIESCRIFEKKSFLFWDLIALNFVMDISVSPGLSTLK